MRPLAIGLASVILLFLATACAGKEQRCQDINSRSIRAMLRESTEGEFAVRLMAALPRDHTVEQYESMKRRLRAQDAAKFKAEMKRKYPADTFIWRPDPAEDSADPAPAPPPRPSEQEWYTENCWEGHAR